jgi:tellurite resistance protein
LSLLLLRVKEAFLFWGFDGAVGVLKGLAAFSACVASGVFLFLLLALGAQIWVRARRTLKCAETLPRGPSKLALERSSLMGLSASAAMPVGMVLLASVWIQWGYPQASQVLWCLGASLEALVSAWVFSRLVLSWHSEGFWASIVPVLLIPAVGNALVVLAGVPLGYQTWSALQFALGCALWPWVWGLLGLRARRLGPLPSALQPTWCILLSPPSVVGLGCWVWHRGFGVPSEPFPLMNELWVVGAWGCWCLAFVSAWQIKPHVMGMLRAPFALSHWAISFPLAAYASLNWALLDVLEGQAHRLNFPRAVAPEMAMTQAVIDGALSLWSGWLSLGVLLALGVLSAKTLRLMARGLAQHL